MLQGQASLFGREEPRVANEAFAGIARTQLDEAAWIEYLPGWVAGHERLLETLARTTAWQTHRRQMYDNTVDVPRLVAALPAHGPGHPLVETMRAMLSNRYGETFTNVSLALYRDGRDSVAWHGDYVAREMDQALVATVSLGAPRKFLMRPKGGGASRAMMLGWGDLLVMGGSSQRTWDHAIPKVARAEPRLSIMFRPTWYVP